MKMLWEGTIDLYQAMKCARKQVFLYLCILVFCAALGAGSSFVLSWLHTREPVYAVDMILDYEVPSGKTYETSSGLILEMERVHTMRAPDGTELDPTFILSSDNLEDILYQTGLNDEITVAALRDRIHLKKGETNHIQIFMNGTTFSKELLMALAKSLNRQLFERFAGFAELKEEDSVVDDIDQEPLERLDEMENRTKLLLNLIMELTTHVDEAVKGSLDEIRTEAETLLSLIQNEIQADLAAGLVYNATQLLTRYNRLLVLTRDELATKESSLQYAEKRGKVDATQGLRYKACEEYRRTIINLEKRIERLNGLTREPDGIEEERIKSLDSQWQLLRANALKKMEELLHGEHYIGYLQIGRPMEMNITTMEQYGKGGIIGVVTGLFIGCSICAVLMLCKTKGKGMG